jgi:hypothetical protein
MYFLNFTTPILNDAGQASFYGIATPNSVGPSLSGAWVKRTDSVELVALAGNHAPGTPPDVNFFSLINGLVLLNDSGHTAFSSFVRGSPVNTITEANDIGIWSDSSGTLQLVAREGDQAPDTSGGTLFDRFSEPVMNDVGQIAFAGSTVGLNGPGTLDGIWSGAVGDLRLKFRTEDHAPGTPAGVNFHAFTEPALNNAGRTAFYALLTGEDVASSNGEGIWSEGSGNLEMLARKGSQAPGTPSGVNFAGFNYPVINTAGKTAFVASLSGSSVDQTNGSGLWTDSSGDLALAFRAGEQAPGTPTGAKFGGFGTPAVNAEGQLAFIGSLYHPTPPRGGPPPDPQLYGGVDDTNDQGIWATDLNGTLRLIAREGDQFEVAPSDLRTIATLKFAGNTGNEDGRASGFNDAGQIAFSAFFTDGSSGVFVSNVVANSLPGDFNSDGIVDAADYVVWRNTSSSDQTKYNTWRANFGRTGLLNNAAASATGALEIPEPFSHSLLGFSLIVFGLLTRQKRRVRRQPPFELYTSSPCPLCPLW